MEVMERLPRNLACFKPYPGVLCDSPSRSKDRKAYAFFNTPFFASRAAEKTYGRDTLLNCLAFLRNQARQLNGIDSVQIICDKMGEHRHCLVFIEEREGDERGIGIGILSESDKPFRTIAILDYEHYPYCLRDGWEWCGMHKIEDNI